MRTWPARTPAQLAELHADPKYFRHPYFEARRDLGRDTLRAKHVELLKLLIGNVPTRGKRLLDVGCDTGSLLAVARDEFDLDVVGLEVSPAAAQAARERHGLTVHVAQPADSGLAPESFDFITLIDVIEHLSDPVAMLLDLRRLLKPGGRIYIATADHNALINSIGLTAYRLLGRRVLGLLEKLYIPFHEFYFTQRTLDAVIRKAGFENGHHAMKEFPLDEFGHGTVLKLGLIPIFALQKLLRRQTLQELVAVKPVANPSRLPIRAA